MKKCAHIGRTRPKNVRPAAEMCAPGAECTLNFEHWHVAGPGRCECVTLEKPFNKDSVISLSEIKL